MQAPTEIILTSEDTQTLPTLREEEEEETPEEIELSNQIENEIAVSSKQPLPSIDPMTLSILPSGPPSQEKGRQETQREQCVCVT